MWVTFIIVAILLLYWFVARRRQPHRPSTSAPQRARRHHRPRQNLLPGLPALFSDEELAAALGISMQEYHWLLDRRDPDEKNGHSRHYQRFDIPKARGGTRVLLAPKLRLKTVQRWILRHILEQISPHDAAHGFHKGRSIVSNAQAHAGQPAVLCIDLRDFFTSINYLRVRGFFRAIGYPAKVAAALGLLCTTRLPGSSRRVLPQGAPTSPALANLVARCLDFRMAGLAAKYGYRYTRYADDCTFSGDPRRLHIIIRTMRAIIKSEGFRLHEGKVRIHRPGACQQVTGLVVNRAPAVSRAARRRMRAILHQAQQTGVAAQNRLNHPHFLDYLRGNISFIRMVNPAHARPLETALAHLLPIKKPVDTREDAPFIRPPMTSGLDGYTAGAEGMPE